MASHALASRSRMQTCAPSSRKRAAVAAPIPLAPPVMRTRLFFRPRMWFSGLDLGLLFSVLPLSLSSHLKEGECGLHCPLYQLLADAVRPILNGFPAEEVGEAPRCLRSDPEGSRGRVREVEAFVWHRAFPG